MDSCLNFESRLRTSCTSSCAQFCRTTNSVPFVTFAAPHAALSDHLLLQPERQDQEEWCGQPPPTSASSLTLRCRAEARPTPVLHRLRPRAGRRVPENAQAARQGAIESFWRPPEHSQAACAQAWVVFADVPSATNALRALQGAHFYDRPLVRLPHPCLHLLTLRSASLSRSAKATWWPRRTAPGCQRRSGQQQVRRSPASPTSAGC